MSVPDPQTLREIVARAHNPKKWNKWQQVAEQVNYCHQPIHLRDGSRSILKACGNRRETVCPPCSQRYKADMWQLVSAGLRGGKGVPETITDHPAVFATFTAHSFGPVHSTRKVGNRAGICRKRSGKCPHGRPLGCRQKHNDSDSCVGKPFCTKCFDYEQAVIWNALAPELWRRTTIYIKRALAKHIGVSQAELNQQIRLSYTKVVEYQKRGTIHYHAVIRLDAKQDDWQTPNNRFTAELLIRAIQDATNQVQAPSPLEAGHTIRWGTQLDIKTLHNQETTAEKTASYIAKYATKATEIVTEHDNEHSAKYRDATARLGRRPELAHLRLHRKLNTLGYGGHCTTKSRRYSTTLKALRHARAEHQQRTVETTTQQNWQFTGRGHPTQGDQLLIRTADQERTHQRRIARQETRALPTGATP